MSEDPRLDRAVRAVLDEVVASTPSRRDQPVAAAGRQIRDTTRVPYLVLAAAAAVAAIALAGVLLVGRTRITPTVEIGTPAPTAAPVTAAPTTTVPLTTTTTATTATAITTAPPTTTAPSAATSPQRLRFDPGTDSATRSGTVAAGETGANYELEARAGQAMTISFIRGAALAVYAPDGSEVGSGTEVRVVLPQNGDYTIVAGPAAPDDLRYEFTVRIPEPERIEFAAGSGSDTRSEFVDSGEAGDAYVLRAGAGQTMTLVFEVGSLLGVYGPDGQTLDVGDGRDVSVELPATGDYTIVAGPEGPDSPSYTFTVRVTG